MRKTFSELRGLIQVERMVMSRLVRDPHFEKGDESTLTYEISLGKGVSLEEARAVSALLGAEVDIAAINNAYAGGAISEPHRKDAIAAAREGYKTLLAMEIAKQNGK